MVEGIREGLKLNTIFENIVESGHRLKSPLIVLKMIAGKGKNQLCSLLFDLISELWYGLINVHLMSKTPDVSLNIELSSIGGGVIDD